ncbi:hypothetical protein [Microvirga brassicacearum]|jgi:hypothetical protein|uniref:DUF1328 domain-containing protein n=1 Tax=Microvirga brassicacearum TaxID=2580413 RepID=A0A5N3PJ22_9HYPH|nr:hypothetical protein [Microvirga brassicacearum]KAB0269728.1 hypothetical protein FEZ63_00210 [Microvirga brassicacearum]
MNRSVALRAFLIFTTITAFAAITGILSQAAIAEATFLIGASLAAIMLFLATAARRPEAVPVRVRARR